MADGSLSIAGPITLTQLQIRHWWGSRGNARINGTIDQLIAAYISEGQDQQIRGDVAFAQAVKETGFFTNNDTKINNFAGIGHFNNAKSGFPYPDVETGVRAHIQLLAKVVDGNGARLNHPDVTHTRWGGRGATTWSGLDDNWAVPGVGYGNSVVALWSQIAADDDGQGTSISNAEPPSNLRSSVLSEESMRLLFNASVVSPVPGTTVGESVVCISDGTWFRWIQSPLELEDTTSIVLSQLGIPVVMHDPAGRPVGDVKCFGRPQDKATADLLGLDFP